MEYFISFGAPGDAEISERIPADGTACEKLLDVPGQDVELTVSSMEEADEIRRPDSCVEVKLWAFHAKEPKTGRIFHLQLKIALTRAETRFLHASLGAMVEHGPSYDPE
jgi:hypothetical protein